MQQSSAPRASVGEWKQLAGALGGGDVAGGRGEVPGRRLPTPGLREAARPHPSARPGPTVELEMADALALGVPGRGAAEAAPHGLGLAALRPPAAAREGHRQQPQAAHARRQLRSRAWQLPAACSPRRQARAGRGRRLTANEARVRRHEPESVANHRSR